jgi:hypothetical protein
MQKTEIRLSPQQRPALIETAFRCDVHYCAAGDACQFNLSISEKDGFEIPETDEIVRSPQSTSLFQVR